MIIKVANPIYASDSKLRQDMNVEDEFFTAIENRDTAIMNRDKKIAERDKKIAENNKVIAEQGQQIAEHIKTLRAAISGLAARGMSTDDIAAVLGKTRDEIERIAGE